MKGLYTKSVELRDREIKFLKEEVTHSGGKVTDLQRQLSTRDEEITKLKAEITMFRTQAKQAEQAEQARATLTFNGVEHKKQHRSHKNAGLFFTARGANRYITTSDGAHYRESHALSEHKPLNVSGSPGEIVEMDGIKFQPIASGSNAGKSLQVVSAESLVEIDVELC